MPRASWKGHLRLSLVSCPVYLSPATTRTKPIRLHQVWVPRADMDRDQQGRDMEEDEPAPRQTQANRARRSTEFADDFQPVPSEEIAPATRISLRPHDPQTGEEIDRDEVVKGYEFERGQFVTITPAELKALDVPSSKTIDLTSFVPRAEIDPIYFDAGYYVYPDGQIATEAYRVVGTAMAESGMAGLGRLTLSRRERMVLVEPAAPG